MAHTTVVDASSAAGGGTVPSVRGFGRVDRRTSARNVGARKIRQELRARTVEGFEPQVDVALPRPRYRPSGVWANNDVCRC